jgi:isoquinoline 1-oxidoreductase beta subunit
MPENGNGVMTQVGMTIAEELRCDLDKVQPEFASPTRDFLEDGVYSASGGMLAFFAGRSTAAERSQVLLQAGASARERLKTAAASRWGVTAAEVEAEDSVLTNTVSGETLRFGEVAIEAAAAELDEEPVIKPESEWTLLGKRSLGKMNNPLIVTGKATYGIDVLQEGMLYAALKQSPVQGGRLKSYDEAAIKDMPGVHSVVVIDPDEERPEPAVQAPFGPIPVQSGVAVVAQHYWQAKKALDALPIEWEDGPGAEWASDTAMRDAAFAALDGEELEVVAEMGDVSDIDAQATVVEAEYWTPYTDNAPIEPLNGTALMTDDRVDVWHPTQHTQQAWALAVAESGVAPENVHVHPTFIGGAFGRRVFGDDVSMVVAIAKKVKGTPVHVIWSREEMFRQGRYRSAYASRFKAGLGSDGMPVAWESKAAGDGVFLSYYHDGPMTTAIVPNVSVQLQRMPFHIMPGPNRGPGYNTFAFMVESFVDELAEAAGVDPLEYRLQLYANYRDPGWVKCLEVVAEKSGWGKELPKGQGMGVAISNWSMTESHFGTTVAAVAQVEVSQEGELKVTQIDVAFDTGKIMNEDAVRAQYEGGTIWGLNLAVNEGLTIENGAIVEGNFDTYPMMRMGDIPPINVHFDALTGHDRFGEIGESPVGPVGAAVANAIFAATGKRVRSMPFRNEDLSWS